MPKKGDTYQFPKELKVQVVQNYLYNEGSQWIGAEILKYTRLFRLKLDKALYQTKA